MKIKKTEDSGTVCATNQLLAPDRNLKHNACLKRASMSWYLYADGYRRAAELLVENCNSFYDKNTMIYPIIFLYRQYIELSLKDIIREANKILSTECKVPKIHDLDKLWPICQKIIKERKLPIAEADIVSIKSCISQFCEVDPTSMSFRYPETKDGNSLLPPNLDSISLRGLADTMKNFSAMIKKIVSLLDADIELENENNSYIY